MNTKHNIKNIIKRNGTISFFDEMKIINAINKAMISSGEGSYDEAIKVSDSVCYDLSNMIMEDKKFVPTVEIVQNITEKQLMFLGFPKTARNYILYRNERDGLRKIGVEVPEHVKKLTEESKKYFRNSLSEFVYYRTYAKWIEKEGRRETWIETVDRYVNFMKEKLGDMLKDSEYKEVRESILKQEVMPSMRLLQFAGPAADRTNVCAYNCSFIAPSKIEDFGEILYILMCGTGVGFSVESQNVDKLPAIVRQCEGNNIIKHTVEDSKEGWADALTLGIKTWFNGDDVIFDYSLLRPAGARLKTFGGKSSGPQPLINLLNFTRERILKRASSKLRNVDVHDIVCKIGECVVSGGVRRSALISLSDLNDTEMREAKTGQFWNTEGQRMLANNSAVYKTKPSETEFLKEWLSLMESGTGERGIFNRGGLAKTLPERRLEVSEKYFDELGTNPCFSEDTLILTKKGLYPIKQLVGKKIEVYDGSSWVMVDNFRVTGENQEMIKIELHDGSSLRVTPYHTMVLEDGTKKEARFLEVDDRLKIYDPIDGIHGDIKAKGAYVKGFLIGDGTSYKDRPILNLYNTKYCCEQRLKNSIEEIETEEINTNSITEVLFKQNSYNRKSVSGLTTRKNELFNWAKDYKNELPNEIYLWDKKSKLDFLAGLMDSDGTALDTKNGFGYQISSINKKLLEGIQILLKTLGVDSTLRLNKKAGLKDFKDGYGKYESKDLYRLTISQIGSKKLSECITFERLVNFKNKNVSYILKKRWNRVAKIEPDGIDEKVYCCTVGTTHTLAIGLFIITGQCGEIILRSRQFCNLSEVIARSEDTEESLLKKIRVATILGTYQSTLTKFGYLSREWKKNCEEERLLGVSVTGQWDSKVARNPEILEKLRKESIRINKLYAKRFGVSESTCITAVKPSGTVSQTVDCASGMHPRHAPYYIRRVRISATDSLFKMMKDQGVPYYPEVGQDKETANTYVLEFPVKAPEGAIVKDDISAIDQLEHWKVVKVNYTEHNPSVTVSIGDNEWIEVANWVYKNWDIVGGLSFLPRSNHVYQLAPYEAITKEKYEELLKNMPELDFSKIVIYELKDETEVKKELACSSGACDLI
jgi:ribonucleotide reductase, class II